jgi:YidC/Oxa1 family membrane protein insertase
MQDKNTLLRILVPLILLIVGVGVAVAVFRNSTAGAPPAGAGGPVANVPPASGSPAPAQPTGPADSPAAPISGLHAQVFDDAADFTPVGDLDPSGPFMIKLEFSRVGAGLTSLRLARHFDTIERLPDGHTLIQGERTKQVGSAKPTLTPMAALGIRINGALVELSGVTLDGSAVRRIWRQTAPGEFEAIILDEQEQPVARVVRRYELKEGSYDVALRQTVENLTTGPMDIRWYQLGPVDLPKDAVTYGGDKRRVRFGYLPPRSINPGGQYVAADEFLWPRESAHVMGKWDKAAGRYPAVQPLWPNASSIAEGYEPVWVGMTNRYFGVSMHPLIDPDAPAPNKALRVDPRAGIDRVLLDPADGVADSMSMAVRLNSPQERVEAGASLDMSLGLYAGPLSHPVIRKDDARASLLRAVGIDGIVVYNFGGPCAWCTFTWLTEGLLVLLLALHDWVFHDWALAIIFLVVCVRGALHPVTKWSQIRVQRFGKQMQDMAPKQKKIQEKFGHDKKQMQSEMARLWKEEGINPAGMLGCLPMFLQTPIWIALYAMLYFAFELRHEPAFFGVFQHLTGGNWWFMGDLAEPDRAVLFGTNYNIPFLSSLMGPIHSLNLLPFILGVVFFAHQKYLTPPPSAAMTPEQIQQQKIMKWMTVVMFPVFMYNAPSGLAVYFIANSTFAIFESRYIRAHITKHDLMNPKGGKPTGGFMKYLNDIADRQRQTLQNRFGQQRPARTGDKGKPDPRRGDDEPPRRFKGR